MRNGKLTNSINAIVLTLLAASLWPAHTFAQDALPGKAEADVHSRPPAVGRIEMLLKFVEVSPAMPASFEHTLPNVLSDPDSSLIPFWEKLTLLDSPVRIVHIGDSHVRGHVFPYIMRTALETDFGAQAVESVPVTYQTSGLATETGQDGIIYHMLGVNGATCERFATEENLQEIAALQPDLVILSFGTNEAHVRHYDAGRHRQAMSQLLDSLHRVCPQAVFLLTTPPGAYQRAGRRGRIVNPHTRAVVDTQLRFARERHLAVWDLYHIAGGEQAACRNWAGAGMYQHDKIHFTRQGYILQGLLLHEAFIKAYNSYVANRLD